jgi:polyisoprenoid-binding protein YceI
MAERFRIDPTLRRFTLQAFSTGALSVFAHNPTFVVRDFSGTIRLDVGRAEGLALDLTVRADSLDLLDRVSAKDRAEILDRMRREVLETALYPEIAYRATAVSADAIDRGRYRVRLGGELSLHGVARPHQIDADLTIFEDGLGLGGGCPLLLSDFRIRSVTALGGTIRLKDELSVSFDIAAVPEGS